MVMRTSIPVISRVSSHRPFLSSCGLIRWRQLPSPAGILALDADFPGEPPSLDSKSQGVRDGWQSGIVARVPLLDAAAIRRDGTFVFEIDQTVVGKWFGRDRPTGVGRLQQAPCLARGTAFQQEVPVKEGMVVRQNGESRHVKNP